MDMKEHPVDNTAPLSDNLAKTGQPTHDPATPGMLTNRTFFTKFVRSVEGRIFFTGIIMAFTWFVSIATLLYQHNALWSKMLTMGFAHMLAGRAASVAHATQAGIRPMLIVFLAVYLDVTIMFIMYGILVFSYKHFLERRFFKKHMSPVFESAKRNMGAMRRFQIAGVFLFVWFPFWMTGIVVGALVGFLLGFRTWVNMLTVLSGTTAAMLCWVFAYDKLFKWSGNIHPGIPMALVAVIITVLLLFRIFSLKRSAKPPAATGSS